MLLDDLGSKILDRMRGAFSCSSWLKKQDEDNILKNYFSPNLNEKEKERASLEGWIIGVK